MGTRSHLRGKGISGEKVTDTLRVDKNLVRTQVISEPIEITLHFN
jgi:hypothetical protein